MKGVSDINLYKYGLSTFILFLVKNELNSNKNNLIKIYIDNILIKMCV